MYWTNRTDRIHGADWTIWIDRTDGRSRSTWSNWKYRPNGVNWSHWAYGIDRSEHDRLDGSNGSDGCVHYVWRDWVSWTSECTDWRGRTCWQHGGNGVNWTFGLDRSERQHGPHWTHRIYRPDWNNRTHRTHRPQRSKRHTRSTWPVRNRRNTRSAKHDSWSHGSNRVGWTARRQCWNDWQNRT